MVGMDFFLLCLSLLGTAQARIPLRYGNSTSHGATSDGVSTTTTSSTTMVGDYIAAGLGLTSTSTSTSTSKSIESTSVESSRIAEAASVSSNFSSSSSESVGNSKSSPASDFQSATDSTASTRSSSSNAPDLTSSTSTSSKHVPSINQAALRSSSTALAGNATASNKAFALVTAATTSFSSMMPSNAKSIGTSKNFTTSILGTGSLGNRTNPANATMIDRCWAQWSSYWSMEESPQSILYTTTQTETDSTYSAYWTAYEYTTTSTEYNGNFATATEVVTLSTSELTQVFSSPTKTYTTTWMYSGAVSYTSPPCALPSYVSDCQSSWLTFLNLTTYTHSPSCTQASITGSVCSTVISSWLESVYAYGGGEISGKAGLTATLNNVTTTASGSTYITSTVSYYWPTSSTIVPGCTLGCQSCRVSGNRVKLLYWPSATSSALGPVTATAYDTTFTSPTVYISFDSLWGLNSCSDVGTPMTNVILPITNTATMSSIYGWGRYWAADYLSASFNFTDLYNTPVPDSIYASQPRCASSSTSLIFACITTSAKPYPSICQAKYPCARTLPYEPVISVPFEVRNLQPAWADCMGGLNGVYDPPQALHQAASEALPGPPSPTKGGSTSAYTTQQSESSPDATTPAAPSPTVAQPVSATKPAPSSDPVQTNDPKPNSPAQTPNDPTNADPPAQTPKSPPNGNPPAQTLNSPSNSDPSSNSPKPEPVDSPQPAQSNPANPAPSTDSPSNDQPNSPDSPQQQPAPSANPSPSNALDVLTDAESNSEATALLSNGSPQTGNTDPEVPQQTQGSNAPATVADSPPQAGTTWTASDGTIVSAHKDGSNVVIAAPGSTAVVSPNAGPVTFAGQTISQDGSHLLVDGSSVAVPAADNTPAPTPAVVWTESNGDVVSAVAQGNRVVIGDSRSSVTITPGADTVFNGQTISAASSGSALVVDGSSMLVPQADITPAAYPVVVMTAPNGDVISAIAQGSNVIVQDGHSAVTIAPGVSAVLDGQTITVAQDGSAILADGSTIAVPSATGSGGLWTALDGQVFSVSTEGNGDIELLGQSTTVILTPGGSPTVFDGQTLSAMQSGQGLLVDGSTIAMSTGAATWTAPDGSLITAMPDGNDEIILVEHGSTITVDAHDGSTVLDGHTISALLGGSAVVIDGTTVSVPRTSSGSSIDEGDGKHASASMPKVMVGGVATAAPTSRSGASSQGSYLYRTAKLLWGSVVMLMIFWS